MAIPNETILIKMMNELKEAQLNQNNHRQMVKHIENVRLLSELIIEEDSVGPESKSAIPKNISDDEMKAMLGDTGTKKINDTDESEVDHDNANGKSIFDF